MGFECVESGIYRLTVPFEDLYTSVFALREGENWLLCDTACNDFDVENYILPALKDLGAEPKYILCSHSHSDHAGGLFSVIKAFLKAKIILKPTVLSDRFEVLSLKGHTDDSLAVFDRKTKTLLSFDCLQQRGIGKYRNGIFERKEYLKTIEKVRKMNIEKIIFSHNYDPCGYIVKGKAEIEKVLKICEENI